MNNRMRLLGALALVACGGRVEEAPAPTTPRPEVLVSGAPSLPEPTAAPPTGRAAKVTPAPKTSDVCHWTDASRGVVNASSHGLALEGPDKKLFVDLSRIYFLTNVEVSFEPATLQAHLSAETSTFLFHGESSIENLTVHPKAGAFGRGTFSYRMWTHVVPGSFRADGTVAIPAATTYSWFVRTPAAGNEGGSERVPCDQFNLTSGGAKPAHWQGSKGGAYLKHGARTSFMREPGRDVVATIGNPKKFDVSGEVDVLVLAKQGAFTQVDVRIGPDLQGIGWVSNDALEPMTSSGSVAGFLKGSEIKEPNYTYYTCNENLPLWADVHGELHEFGLIKKGGKFRGAPNPQGDFRVNLGDRVDWSSEVPFTNAWDPFVGKERLESAGCKTMSKEQYLR